MEPRWRDSTILPDPDDISHNVAALMKPTDEVMWQHSGLFASVDTLDTSTLTLKSTQSGNVTPHLPSSSNDKPCLPPPLFDSLPGLKHSARKNSKVSFAASGDTHTVRRLPFLLHQGYILHKTKKEIVGDCGNRSRHTGKWLWAQMSGLEQAARLALCGLVGRVSYRYLSDITIQDWVQTHWVPLLGYAPEILF
jgi:hypothetical protein